MIIIGRKIGRIQAGTISRLSQYKPFTSDCRVFIQIFYIGSCLGQYLWSWFRKCICSLHYLYFTFCTYIFIFFYRNPDCCRSLLFAGNFAILIHGSHRIITAFPHKFICFRNFFRFCRHFQYSILADVDAGLRFERDALYCCMHICDIDIFDIFRIFKIKITVFIICRLQNRNGTFFTISGRIYGKYLWILQFFIIFGYRKKKWCIICVFTCFTTPDVCIGNIGSIYQICLTSRIHFFI